MISCLDHCGLAVADLDAARARFSALGFTVSARETLTRPDKEGRLVDSGADNAVIMMARGYQELITITDAAAGHMLVPRLSRYLGLHSLVLGCDDAAAARDSALARGARVGALATWGRAVKGMGEARFRFFMFADEETPECLLGVVQHLTPQLLRPPDLLNHANRAEALRGCTLHVADAAEAALRYSRILGISPADGVIRFCDGTYLRLADRTTFARDFPGATPAPAPSVACVDYQIGDLGAVMASGIPIMRDECGAWIDPRHGFGAILRLTPAA
jgi:hypothetical protein